MTRVRLLSDVDEGAPGAEVLVTPARARALVAAGQAERVIDRQTPVENTGAGRQPGRPLFDTGGRPRTGTTTVQNNTGTAEAVRT